MTEKPTEKADAPVNDALKEDAPANDALKANAPANDAPKADAPKTDAPPKSSDVEAALLEKLDRTSTSPGVYLMKDAGGRVLYVGKAGSLKKRLASYFQKPGGRDVKTWALVKKIKTFDTILTDTEKEALILESNLIKRHKPRYNIVLKDDKRYPVLRLDMNHPYPSLSIVRKIEKDGAMFFGPYSSASAVRQTLKIVNKTFKLRKCKPSDFKTRNRPCLHHQMKGCLAPCCLEVERSVYQEMVKEVILFLKGRTPALIKKIKSEMMAAAESQDFERAANQRDKMFSLQKTVEKQIAVTTDLGDRDVIGVASAASHFLMNVMFIRGGYLLGSRRFIFTETISSDQEAVGAFIKQYYEKSLFVPRELLSPVRLEDQDLLEEWLLQIKGARVRILIPRRGEKVRLVKMAMKNAENELAEHIASIANNERILEQLGRRLRMNGPPRRVECFDNSNFSGAAAVAGMVVFENGKPEKSRYRKYKIKTVSGQDDYAYMAEVLGRRYGKGEKSRPYPDLLMVDGGKGQLNIAMSILKELNLTGAFHVIGIAKKDELRGETADKIYMPGRANPVNLGKGDELLFHLQRIRDEAHRFAISFHRRRRAKTSVHSELDEIPGVGPKRKRTLLKSLGGVNKIRAAAVEELSALPGMNQKAAEAVLKALARKGD
ncbi:MAG: excinuclease ABC subunit UvrC [Desulfobacterales bacterium]|nr:excinuclease ABC subunit UvrC [Desulfobacterales bacterium]